MSEEKVEVNLLETLINEWRKELTNSLNDNLVVSVAYNTQFYKGRLGDKHLLSTKKQQKELKLYMMFSAISPLEQQEILAKIENAKDVIDLFSKYEKSPDNFWYYILSSFFLYQKTIKKRSFSNNYSDTSVPKYTYSKDPQLQCLTYIVIHLKKNHDGFDREVIKDWLQGYSQNEKNTDWINNTDKDQIEWAHKYIDKYILQNNRDAIVENILLASNHPEPIDLRFRYSYICMIINHFSLHLDTFEFKLFIKDMKSAYSSKKYRDKNDGKKSKSFKISVKSIRRFSELAKQTQLNHNDLLELLIERADRKHISLEPQSQLLDIKS